jgi:hypothetical protein
MDRVSIVAVVLLVCAVLVIVGAEWPRLVSRLGIQPRERRSRERRKRKLTVIEGLAAPDDADEFARSVERDLESLPVFDPRDRRK